MYNKLKMTKKKKVPFIEEKKNISGILPYYSEMWNEFIMSLFFEWNIHYL